LIAVQLLFVDLVPIEDPSRVASTPGSALGARLESGGPISAVIDFLHDEPLLIE